MQSNNINDFGTQPTPAKMQASQSPAAILDSSQRFNQAERASTVEKSATTQQTTPATLETAVTQLNDYVQTVNRTLAFSIDEDSGQTVVKVFNRDTEELIRQLPAEHTLKLAASLEKHTLQGVLFEAKA